ncbi:regulator, partial [Escherichia coli]
KLYLLAWMPREQALALLDALADEPHKGEEGILPIFGIDALPIFVRYLKHDRQSLWPFTPYCGTTDLALPMAQNFSRKKTLREDARSWLLEYPEHAIAGLLPAALGKACKDRD